MRLVCIHNARCPTRVRAGESLQRAALNTTLNESGSNGLVELGTCLDEGRNGIGLKNDSQIVFSRY